MDHFYQYHLLSKTILTCHLLGQNPVVLSDRDNEKLSVDPLAGQTRLDLMMVREGAYCAHRTAAGEAEEVREGLLSGQLLLHKAGA